MQSASRCLFLGFIFFLAIFHVHSHLANFLAEENDSTNLWAVLVAGSDAYMNYRHQADVCHAYQVLHNHGIPDERIIVMMKDDIAYNEENPTPGVIINHPNGSNVYPGVPHDYTGADVTPKNFLSVLKGDKEAVANTSGSKKVLNSGPNDHVFVYFSDHGAPEIIAFPDDELPAEDLDNAIKWMHSNNRYKKLVFYLEACESGSMFENLLPPNISAFATTAASPDQSSYACYYDDKRGTYLGDEYSVNWMEDSDKENLLKESLSKQFKIVKKKTKDSTVEEYGDLSIGKMHISEFQGKKKSVPIKLPKVKLNSVRSRDVPVAILKQKIKSSKLKTERVKYRHQLKNLLMRREYLQNKMQILVSSLIKNETAASNLWVKHSRVSNRACYNEVRKHFNRKCFAIWNNDYALEFMYILVNLCEHGIDARLQKDTMNTVCNHPRIDGIV